MDVYQYICGMGLFALVFLHHAVLSVPINCLPEMVEVHLLSGHLFDSVLSNVSSNSMPVRMQSHIGCICLTFLHCASLNVSSNCLPEKKHSRTDYICLAFLNCVFSNVVSIACPRRGKVTLVAFFYFSTLFFFKWPAREDAKSHWLHLFGFSPQCVFKCVLKTSTQEVA